MAELPGGALIAPGTLGNKALVPVQLIPEATEEIRYFWRDFSVWNGQTSVQSPIGRADTSIRYSKPSVAGPSMVLSEFVTPAASGDFNDRLGTKRTS